MANFYLSSSTYEDLTEYREEVPKMLQQMGHEVISMENYTTDS